MNYSIFTDTERIQPKTLKVNEGDNAEFVCISTHETAWLFNEEKLPLNAKIKDKLALVLSEVQKENEGRYECQGTTSTGHIFYAIGSLVVHGELQCNWASEASPTLGCSIEI